MQDDPDPDSEAEPGDKGDDDTSKHGRVHWESRGPWAQYRVRIGQRLAKIGLTAPAIDLGAQALNVKGLCKFERKLIR